MDRLLAFFAGLLLSGSAMAGNFSYTYVGGWLGKMEMKNDIVFNGDLYEEFAYAELGGSIQLGENGIALGVSSAAISNNGPNSSLTESSVSYSLAVPMAMGERVDFVPQVGPVKVELEACDDVTGDCDTTSDSGLGYGFGFRAWLAPEVLELSLGWAHATIDGSEPSLSFGGALWGDESHSFRLQRSSSKDATLTAFGYRYSW